MITTIIMATHDPTISEIADETLIMSDGRMSRDIPEELQGTGILDAMHLPGTLHGEIEMAADAGGLKSRLDKGGPKTVQLPPMPAPTAPRKAPAADTADTSNAGA